jgi:hypothetical protein
MANDTAAVMLGYGTKQRMLGHNVNVIVPPPFSKVLSKSCLFDSYLFESCLSASCLSRLVPA